MFKFFKKLFGWTEPSPKKPVQVGEEFEVNDPDQARLEIVRRCFESGQMITGSAVWDEETGKGRIRIESAENVDL